jgi:hypothetical protein
VRPVEDDALVGYDATELTVATVVPPSVNVSPSCTLSAVERETVVSRWTVRVCISISFAVRLTTVPVSVYSVVWTGMTVSSRSGRPAK